MKNPLSSWFRDPVFARGRTAARQWLEANGFDLHPVPGLGSFRPAAYGKKVEGEMFEAIAVVETCETVGSDEARDRMHHSVRWRGVAPGRRCLLFLARGAVKAAAVALADYDGMVVYS